MKRLMLGFVFLWSLIMLWICWRTGVRHDYGAYLKQWGLLLNGMDPWSTNNAYGPIHTVVGYLLKLGTLAPKYAFVIALIIANTAIVIAILQQRKADWYLIIYLISIPVNFLVFYMGIVYGLNDALVAFFLIGAVICRYKAKFVLAGAFVGLAALLKFYPVLLLPFFARGISNNKNIIRFELMMSGVVVFLIGMIVAYYFWGESIFKPFVFGSGREPKLLSIFAALKSTFGDVGLLDFVIRINTVIVLMSVMLAFILCWKFKSNWLESVVIGYLTMLLSYKVGHQQFHIPLLFLIASLGILNNKTSDMLAKICIPLAIFLSLYQWGYHHYKYYAYGTSLGWVRSYGGYIALPLMVGTIYFYFRNIHKASCIQRSHIDEK